MRSTVLALIPPYTDKQDMQCKKTNKQTNKHQSQLQPQLEVDWAHLYHWQALPRVENILHARLDTSTSVGKNPQLTEETHPLDSLWLDQATVFPTIILVLWWRQMINLTSFTIGLVRNDVLQESRFSWLFPIIWTTTHTWAFKSIFDHPTLFTNPATSKTKLEWNRINYYFDISMKWRWWWTMAQRLESSFAYPGQFDIHQNWRSSA